MGSVLTHRKDIRRSSAAPTVIKVVLLGNKRVGKTSLVNMFVHGLFQECTSSCIGGHFMTKTLEAPRVILQLWDATAMGKPMLPESTKGIDCAILVYDISNRESFFAVRDFWLNYTKTGASAELVKILVGAKSDIKVRAVQEFEGRNLAQQNGMLFLETSAKLRINVDKLFAEAAKAVMETMYLPTEDSDGPEHGLVNFKKEKRRFCLISQ